MFWCEPDEDLARLKRVKKVKQPLDRPGRSLTVPGGWGSHVSKQWAHEGGKVSPTHRPPLPSRKYSRYSFPFRLSQPHGHSAAGRIMSMKNSNDTIGNRTRDLPACRIVKEYRSLVVFFSSIEILNLYAWHAVVVCEYREEWRQSVTTALCSGLMYIM